MRDLRVSAEIRTQSTHGVADVMKTALNASTHCSKKGFFIQSLCPTRPTFALFRAKPLHKELILFVLGHALKAMNQIMHTSLTKTDCCIVQFQDRIRAAFPGLFRFNISISVRLEPNHTTGLLFLINSKNHWFES